MKVACKVVSKVDGENGVKRVYRMMMKGLQDGDEGAAGR